MSAQAPEATAVKTCPKCRETKPLSAWFASSPTGACAECRKAGQRARYHRKGTLVERVAELEQTVRELQARLSSRAA